MLPSKFPIARSSATILPMQTPVVRSVISVHARTYKPPAGHGAAVSCGERTTRNGSAGNFPVLSRRMNMYFVMSAGSALWDLGAGVGAAVGRTESGDWSSPGLSTPEDESLPKFVRMESGVRYQVLAESDKGDAAKDGDLIEYDYVLRRPNGYFIYSTVEGVSFQPRDLPVGPVEHSMGTGIFVPGLEQAMRGMHSGSRRRILVPASLGYDSDVKLQPVPPGFAARRQVITHRTEPLVFEVEVLRVKRPR